MSLKCCVVNCASRCKDISFHRFPKSDAGLKKWVQSINCDRLRSLSFEEIRRKFVCAKHSEKRFFALIQTTRQRVRLRCNAYPTLFTASEISSGIPNAVATPDENYTTKIDHDYCRKRKHEDHTYSKSEFVEKRSKTDITDMEIDDISSQIKLPSTSKSGDKGVQNIKKRQRRRVLSFKNRMSPCCAMLYKQYRKSCRQVNFSLRAKKALKFSKEKSFVKLTEALNPTARQFLWMQIKQCTKKDRGRRFTDEEKLISMAIMKQSPKCYRFLKRIFILPSKYTLNKMIAKLNVEAGINGQIFEAVKQEVVTWDEKKKYCSILFDEVALEVGLSYDKHRDIIDGFVDLNTKTSDFADHALVFMLRGLIHKWQQPVAFYFCKGATSAVILKIIIKDVITAVGNTGLKPVALVCDQGTAFQSALKSLQEDTRRQQIIAGEKIDDVIRVTGNTLSVIFDPPHLIKGLRNNFITKHIKYQDRISKWDDIVDVYKTDCQHAQVRLLHKLNDEHVIPNKIKKMKVRNCTQVFSKTVAATLAYTAQFSHYANGQEVSPTLKNTAEVISFFDDLFDSVNGSSAAYKISKGKPLRKAVFEKSAHHAFWREAITKLEKIKFIEHNGKETSVPSLKNWIVTLKSFERLWQLVKDRHIKIMRPRYLNSDPLENFFGQIRAYNFRNNNPDCHTFKNTFRSLLITRFIKFHSDSYNCEEDSGEQLLKIKSLFTNKNTNITSQPICSPESSELPSWIQNENILTATMQERLSVHSQAFTAGWVIRKIINKVKCKNCENNLINKESNYNKNSVNNWISYREFKCIKERKLTYPSENIVKLYGNITKEANKYLETQPHMSCILRNIKDLIKSKYLFDFLNCNIHKDVVVEYFLDLTLKLTVFNWCNTINLDPLLIFTASEADNYKTHEPNIQHTISYIAERGRIELHSIMIN